MYLSFMLACLQLALAAPTNLTAKATFYGSKDN
jgi:hypothetical protein